MYISTLNAQPNYFFDQFSESSFINYCIAWHGIKLISFTNNNPRASAETIPIRIKLSANYFVYQTNLKLKKNNPHQPNDPRPISAHFRIVTIFIILKRKTETIFIKCDLFKRYKKSMRAKFQFAKLTNITSF